MNISNAVYTFINSEVVTVSDPDTGDETDVLYQADMQASLYEAIKAIKTIRVGDVQQSKPTYQLNKVAEKDAYLTVQIIVRPEKQQLAEFLAARDLATSIALRISKMIFLDERLSGNVCDASVEKMRMDWVQPSTLRLAVAFLLLRIDGKGI